MNDSQREVSLFLGHIGFGLGSILLAFLWIYGVSTRYFKAVVRGKAEAFRSTATFSYACCQNVPIEGTCKVLFGIMNITGEIITGMDDDGHFVRMLNAQHIACVSFIVVNGVIDIMIFFNFRLPPDLDYAAMSMAAFVGSFMMYFHMHGRIGIDAHLHKLLSFSFASLWVFTLIEMKNKTNIILVFMRIFCVLTTGICFIGTAFILYHPVHAKRWDRFDDQMVVLATAVYMGQMMLSFIVIASFVALMAKRYRIICASRSYPGVDYKKIEVESLAPEDLVEHEEVRKTLI